MITVGFPPRGGGGVQRNVKFLKYLTRKGWKTNVLTIKDSNFFVKDVTLLDEIPDTKIYRSDSLDPITVMHKVKCFFGRRNKSNKREIKQGEGLKDDAWYVKLYRKLREIVLFPDAYGGWIPFAYRLGKKVIIKENPDVLFASFPGPSNAIITYKLSQKFNLPYIIDFRDAWLDDPYVNFPTDFHRRFHAHYEKKIVLGAKKVVVYGKPLKDILEEKYPELVGRVHIITNGFDPEDIEGVNPKAKMDKVRIVYSGAVSFDRKENFHVFIEALKELDSDALESIEVFFVGKKYDWAFKLVLQENLNETVHFTGYLPHQEALDYLASADAALMFLAAGDVVALTGKVFEYVGLGLPIIACVEKEGACAKMLRSIGHAQGVCNPASSTEIASRLKELVTNGFPKLSGENIEIFSRKKQADLMNDILLEVIGLD